MPHKRGLTGKQWMAVLWPAFLVAGLLEMLVFALVDPQDLHWSGQTVDWSREAVYTLAFFCFWALAAVSGALTTVLAAPPDEVNTGATRTLAD